MMILIEKGHKERFFDNGNKIVEDYEIFQTEIHFTNLTMYKRTTYHITKNVVWETIPYEVIIYNKENGKWRLIDERAKSFIKIPDIEKNINE